MKYDPAALRDRLMEVSAGLPFEVTTRPMMGGFVGYADGKVFVSLSTGGFGVKLTPTDQDHALRRRGARRLQHSPEDPVSKNYIALGDEDVADDDTLIEWLTLAARTAPPGKRS
ncbi:MAG: hypothetical protein NVS4B2_06510 [Chloroflexota bacterium]